MFISRLGAIIKQLEYEGYQFEAFYGREKGFRKENWNNYYYVLIKRPTRS